MNIKYVKGDSQVIHAFLMMTVLPIIIVYQVQVKNSIGNNAHQPKQLMKIALLTMNVKTNMSALEFIRQQHKKPA